MPQTLYIIIYVVCIATCMLMGYTLIFLKTLHHPHNRAYVVAKRYLAAAYFLVGAGNTAVLVSIICGESQVFLFSFINIFFASLQALLFTFSLLVLYNSEYVTQRNVLRHLAPTITAAGLYLFFITIWGDFAAGSFADLRTNITHPTALLQVVYLMVYAVQLGIYSWIFVHERRQFREKIEDYFADTGDKLLHWMNISFWGALSIGIIVLSVCFLPNLYYDSFVTMTIAVYYAVFAIYVINYQYSFLTIYPAVAEEADPVCENPDNGIGEKIEQWAAVSGHYLRPSLVIDDVAAEMDVPRKKLSCHINRVYGVNFNSWINRMRIERAKELLSDTDKKLSLEDISEQVGYLNKSHFLRQFHLYTGETPLRWLRQAAGK